MKRTKDSLYYALTPESVFRGTYVRVDADTPLVGSVYSLGDYQGDSKDDQLVTRITALKCFKQTTGGRFVPHVPAYRVVAEYYIIAPSGVKVSRVPEYVKEDAVAEARRMNHVV